LIEVRGELFAGNGGEIEHGKELHTKDTKGTKDFRYPEFQDFASCPFANFVSVPLAMVNFLLRKRA
jgi:hypothetical protein